MNEIDPAYLTPTAVLDSDNPEVIGFARRAMSDAADPTEQAARIFAAVRDEIAYDPYTAFYLPEHYRASTTIAKGRGYCVIKAVLLCAAARAAKIPARLGFATIRNRQAPQEIKAALGSDLFAWHGYTEMFLSGKWLKATPAFDLPVCEKHDIDLPVFNGQRHCVLPERTRGGLPYVEYIEYHGSFADLPLDELLAGWEAVYGEGRVRLWRQSFEQAHSEG